MLGDKESGKTTLVAKLQGNEDPKKGAGLEYGYIDVRDEYRDGNFSPESYYFDQLIYTIKKSIKWITNPSKKVCLFSVRSLVEVNQAN